MVETSIDRAFILDILKANREQLRNEFGIERIGLYGSFARNEQTEKSDIDLLFDLKDESKLSLTERQRLYHILRNKLRRKLDLVEGRYMNPIIRHYAIKEILYA